MDRMEVVSEGVSPLGHQASGQQGEVNIIAESFITCFISLSSSDSFSGHHGNPISLSNGRATVRGSGVAMTTTTYSHTHHDTSPSSSSSSDSCKSYHPVNISESSIFSSQPPQSSVPVTRAQTQKPRSSDKPV